MIGNIFRTIDDSEELPKILACEEIHFENGNSLLNYKNKIISMREQDLIEVASRYFQDENYSTAILTPEK